MATSLCFVRALLTAVLCLAMVTRANAQTAPAPDSLAGLLLDLDRRVNIFTGFPPTIDLSALASFGNIIALEQSTAPLGTSTGAFNFIFDPQVGAYTRSTASFGPAFSSRSLTTGRNHFSVGFNYLHAGYDSFAGMNLRNGDLKPVRNVQDADQLPRYSELTLDLSSDTVVAFGNFGATDNLDVGIVVPWIRTNIGSQVGLFDASGIDITGGSLRLARTSASGIGDVAIVGKYRVLRQADGGVAAMLQLHLPTGDHDNFRGLGLTRTMIGGVWSMGGRVSPRINLGYEFWSEDVEQIRNQVKYALGAEVLVTPKMTAILDLVGRRLLGVGGYEYESQSFGPVTFDLLKVTRGGLNVVSLAPGIKWNPTGNGLLAANVLVSLANGGLRANVIPVVGIDWTF